MPAGGGGEKGWKGSRRTHRKGEKGGGSDGETKGPGGGPGAAVRGREAREAWALRRQSLWRGVGVGSAEGDRGSRTGSGSGNAEGWEEEGGIAPEAEVWGRGTSPSGSHCQCSQGPSMWQEGIVETR